MHTGDCAELPQTGTLVGRSSFSIRYRDALHAPDDIPFLAFACAPQEQVMLYGHLTAVSDELTAHLRSIGVHRMRFSDWENSVTGRPFKRSLAKLDEAIIYLEGDYGRQPLVLQKGGRFDAPLLLTGYLDDDVSVAMGLQTPRYTYTVYRHRNRLWSNLGNFPGSLSDVCELHNGAVYSVEMLPLRTLRNEHGLKALLANAYRRARQSVMQEEVDHYPLEL
jgi:hypothetical protein